MRLKDKIALVTGSSRGIGKATALLFAREGAIVVINYIESKSEAQETLASVQQLSPKSIAVKADISKEEDIKNMITQVVEKFGKIDILVNNAGIVIDLPFKKRTAKHWKKTLEVNLIGTFLCAKHAVPHMPKGSTIVNISSTNGINSFSVETMDYDASKAGVIILTKDLAKELAPNIRVNSVAPGWVNTSMNKDLPKDFVDEETAKIYLKRFAEPKEIAKAVLFLASDDASYITGSILMVDGGYG